MKASDDPTLRQEGEHNPVRGPCRWLAAITHSIRHSPNPVI